MTGSWPPPMNHVYVSQWHLSKLLNRETGQSFFDLLGSMRIEKDDLVFIVPQNLPEDGAVMLIETGAHRCLRRVKLLGNSQILLQSGDREMSVETLHISDIRFIGRAVRVEFTL